MKKIISSFIIVLFLFQGLIAQNQQYGNSIFWKITGKDVAGESYLFGTYHLLSHAFIDTMPMVTDALNSSAAVITELVLDETAQPKLMQASLLNGSVLSQNISAQTSEKLSKWLATEAGLELSSFEPLNPMAVMTIVMSIAQQKYYPNPQGYLQLDSYFQEHAKANKKELISLETVEQQIDVLFNNFSVQRQSELLDELFSENESIEQQLNMVYNSYLAQEINGMVTLAYESYNSSEVEQLLDNRNKAWIPVLKNEMKAHPTFIAVGALHLAGKNGILQLLVDEGYIVEEIKIRN